MTMGFRIDRVRRGARLLCPRLHRAVWSKPTSRYGRPVSPGVPVPARQLRSRYVNSRPFAIPSIPIPLGNRHTILDSLSKVPDQPEPPSLKDPVYREPSSSDGKVGYLLPLSILFDP